MSSALQQLYASPDSRLPDGIVKILNELREGDETVQRLARVIEEERKVLFEEMKVATDEGNFHERIHAIKEKNNEIVELTTKQQKKAEEAYQLVSNVVFDLDKKRTFFYQRISNYDAKVKKLKSSQKEKEVKTPNTGQEKKKRKNAANSTEMIATETLHTAEPLYCFCKKVSFGRMIGCDNENCPIEWFHFPCVGLDESLPDPEEWFCSVCRSSEN